MTHCAKTDPNNKPSAKQYVHNSQNYPFSEPLKIARSRDRQVATPPAPQSITAHLRLETRSRYPVLKPHRQPTDVRRASESSVSAEFADGQLRNGQGRGRAAGQRPGGQRHGEPGGGGGSPQNSRRLRKGWAGGQRFRGFGDAELMQTAVYFSGDTGKAVT